MGLIGIFIAINLVSIVFADDYSGSASSAADASASAFNNPGCYPVPPIYKECGTACPKTCAQPEDRPCSRECRPGYFCPDGLYMNSAGLCVELKDCNRPHSHPPIPVNGTTGPQCVKPVITECGDSCPSTCENPDPICNGMCRPGYGCPKGYFRYENDCCVDLKYCNRLHSHPPIPVKGHQCVKPVYSQCGGSCPKTCAHPGNRICPAICIPGYSCPNGLYLNSNNLCVELKDCNRPHSHPLIPANGPTPNPWNNFPDFQFDGLNSPNPMANGQPSPPPAVIRSSGFGFPAPSFPAMTPRMKPLINLDPTVPRPVLRVSNEQSSDDDQ